MRLPPCTALVCLVRISLGFVFFFQWDEIIARVIAYDSVTSRFRPSSTGPQELLYIIGAAVAQKRSTEVAAAAGFIPGAAQAVQIISSRAM